MNKRLIFILFIGLSVSAISQDTDESSSYKKRVLESAEVDILSSYYTQDGANAAVSGGIGTESLTDATATIVISIPLNDDDVLTIDAGISAYTSASSSNVNPFDGRGPADPFVASSGESFADVWSNVNLYYSHSSDDRNSVINGKVSFSKEYDYSSVGFGGGFTKLFNQKNTELSLSANAFIDRWELIYPSELRGSGQGGGDDDEDNFNIDGHTVTGATPYSTSFTPLSSDARQSYSLGLGLSQILSKRLQGTLAIDVIVQKGQLSTPFQRVYFADVGDSFIENFHLADDIERLPSSRFKTAVGGRLNYYINERLSARTFFRYYWDDWGITSYTASIEIPIKVTDQFTIYPSYRYYHQSAADYFSPYNQNLSTDTYYTSDYDLSTYNANQIGIGVSYTDIFTSMRLWKVGIKSIDLKYYKYDRDTSFGSQIVTLGIKFVID